MPVIDKKLRIFRVAAQLCHFTEAADALGMTQPNVTQQMAALEREFGLELFNRSQRRLGLTPAGKALLVECDRLFAESGEIKRRLHNAARQIRHYKVGGTMTAGGFLLPGCAAEYMNNRRQSRISLHIANSCDIEEKLKRRELDLALIEGPFDRGFFISKKFLSDELVAAAPPGLLQKKFSLRDYIQAGGSFVLRESGSGTRYCFDHFLEDNGLPPPAPAHCVEANNFDAIKHMLLCLGAITVISRLAVVAEVAAGTLEIAEFTEGKLIRDLTFIYSPMSDNVSFAEDMANFPFSESVRRGGCVIGAK